MEEWLAMLLDSDLEKIIADDCIRNGMEFDALWKEWGKKGYLNSEPMLLDLEYPSLRLRHDCYLSWFRGYRFQNSYDYYGDGSNGESANNLREILQLLENISYNNEDLFKTAMLISYPLEAMSQIKAGHSMLREHPELFDLFMKKTALECMSPLSFELVSVKDMQLKFTQERTGYKPALTLYLANAWKEKRWVFATLNYYLDCVELTWSSNSERKCLAVKFPEWTLTRYNESPGLVYKDEYLKLVWNRLTITLLGLARIVACWMYMRPLVWPEFELAPMQMFPESALCLDLNQVYNKIETKALTMG